MMAAVFLLVEAVLVAGLGIWMAVAVYDNWRHPRLNREAVATVMRLDLMARDFPEDYAFVSHRRVVNNRIIDVAFYAIRWAETFAAAILGLASALLMGAAFGWIPLAFAQALAVLATTYFCAIWAGFIIGGNYFHYYFCHQWGQSNHFMFMYWGMFVLVILIV